MTCGVPLTAIGQDEAGWLVVLVVDQNEIFALLLYGGSDGDWRTPLTARTRCQRWILRCSGVLVCRFEGFSVRFAAIIHRQIFHENTCAVIRYGDVPNGGGFVGCGWIAGYFLRIDLAVAGCIGS